jgi:hypothetical protein
VTILSNTIHQFGQGFQVIECGMECGIVGGCFFRGSAVFVSESSKTATLKKMLAFNRQSIIFFSPIIVICRERGPAGIRSLMDGL